MKRIFGAFLSVLLVTMLVVNSAFAVGVSGTGDPQAARKGGVAWTPILSTYTWGSAANRWAEIYAVIGDFTTAIIGGIGLGAVDMDGHPILMDTDGDWGFFNDRHASVANDEFAIGKTGALDFKFAVDTFTALAGSSISGADGATFTNPGGGATSEEFGAGADTGSNASATAVGETASVSGTNGTAVGETASVSGTNGTAIGKGSSSASGSFAGGVAANAGTNGVSIGVSSQNSSSNSVSVGWSASTGTRGASFGYGTNSGTDGISLGYDAESTGFTGSIALGSGSRSTAANQWVVGSGTIPITTFYIGEGATSTTPGALTIQGTKTATTETDVAGSTVTIASGEGTGAGAVSTLIFQTPAVTASGTSQQTLETRLTLSEFGATAGQFIVFDGSDITARYGTGIAMSGFFGIEWSEGLSADLTHDVGLYRSDVNQLKVTAGTGVGSIGNLVLGSLSRGAETTDIATVDLVVTATDAPADSTFANLTGSDLVLAGGIGTKFVTIIDFTQVADTITVTVNGSATALVENTDFNGETSNDVTATNLAVAIEGISGVSASATSAVVNITPDAGTYSLFLAETGVLATVTNSADGSVSSPGIGANSEEWGAGADAGSNPGSTVFGNTATCTDGNCVAIGFGATVDGASAVAIGRNASAAGGSAVAIGLNTNASGSGSNVVIGDESSDNGSAQVVVIGGPASATGSSTVVIGDGASSIQDSVVIGQGAVGGHAGVIVLGRIAASTAANQFVAGSSSLPITTVYFGEGVTSTTPQDLTFQGTNTTTTETDVAAGDLIIQTGAGTGNATVADLIFATATVQGSGTSAQTQATRLTINESGSVFTGGITSPTVTLGTASSATGQVTFLNSANANTLIMQPGATSTSYTMTWPLAVAQAAGEVLTDAAGDGVLSWAAVAPALSAVLAVGNATGGTSLLVTSGDIIDSATGVPLVLGGTTATSVTLGRSGQATTIKGTTVHTPSSVTTLAAGTTLTVANTIELVDGDSGAVTLTSTPNIANGTVGQCVKIFGDDGTNTVTFQDADNLGSSGLALAGDVNIVLGAGDNFEVCYITLNSVTLWREISRSLSIDD